MVALARPSSCEQTRETDFAHHSADRATAVVAHRSVQVGRARNAQSSIFGADEGAPAKTGAAAPAAGDAAGAAVVAGGDACGKRVMPGGSRGENMANALSWS